MNPTKNAIWYDEEDFNTRCVELWNERAKFVESYATLADGRKVWRKWVERPDGEYVIRCLVYEPGGLSMNKLDELMSMNYGQIETYRGASGNEAKRGVSNIGRRVGGF